MPLLANLSAFEGHDDEKTVIFPKSLEHFSNVAVFVRPEGFILADFLVDVSDDESVEVNGRLAELLSNSFGRFA